MSETPNAKLEWLPTDDIVERCTHVKIIRSMESDKYMVVFHWMCHEQELFEKSLEINQDAGFKIFNYFNLPSPLSKWRSDAGNNLNHIIYWKKDRK